MDGCQDRRDSKRMQTECQVLLKHLPGQAINLSAEGARVMVRQSIELRQTTTLTLLTEDGECFSLVAVPIWQKTVASNLHVVGVHFLPNQAESVSYCWWLGHCA